MKKNKVMRIASILMVAALVSTCAISGTFAKYVTGDSADDAARVAKFGVTVLASGALYSDTYKASAEANDKLGTPGVKGDLSTYAANSANLSVVSIGFVDNFDGEKKATKNGIEGTDNVVAPGTKNDKGITFTVAGKPEVATSVSAIKNLKFANEEITLKKNEKTTQIYGVMVEFAAANKEAFDEVYAQQSAKGVFKYAEGKFTKVEAFEDEVTVYYALHDVTDNVTADYLPVKYTLKNRTAAVLENKTLAEVIAKIEETVGNHDANYDYSAVDDSKLQITWQWDYEAEAVATAHKAYIDAKAAYDADTTDANKTEMEQKYAAYLAAEKADFTDEKDTILGDLIAQQKGATGFKVVVVDLVDNKPSTATEIKFAQIAKYKGNDLDANAKVIVAYTDAPDVTPAVPTEIKADGTLDNGNLVAILSTTFAIDITVTQID